MPYSASSNGAFRISNSVIQTKKSCSRNYDSEYINAWNLGTNFKQIGNGFYITSGEKEILQLQGPIL
jgi:hypothetical protein